MIHRISTTTLALVCVLAMLGWPTLASAQAPVAITLDDAIQRGLASAPRLREAEARGEAAAATRDARATLDRPALNLTTGYLRTNHVDEYGIPQPGGGTRVLSPDIPDNYRLRADVMWPVWTGGRVNALVESAEAERRATEADAAVIAADLRLEIAQAYWGLVTARETVKVIDQSLQRTDAWVRDVQARLDVGLVSPHEVLTAKAQRARHQVQRIQASHAATTAERELARLIGMTGQSIDPVSPVDQPSAQTQDAAGVRAERVAFTERQSAFRSAAAAAVASRHPQVAAIAGLEPARPNNRFVPRQDKWHTSWDLGVTVTWSLWDGGRARADRAVAEAQAQALGHRLEEFDARVAVDVQARRLDIEAAVASIAASDEAVAAATEAHRVLQERYAAGVATSTEVLDAQVALLDATLERTKLQAGLRVSEARLRRALGVR